MIEKLLMGRESQKLNALVIEHLLKKQNAGMLMEADTTVMYEVLFHTS